MSGARRDLLVATLLGLGAVVIFFPGLVFFHQVVFAQDTWVLHLPARAYLANRLRHGQLPLWYPYDGLGAPFVQSTVLGVFHPLTLLVLVLRPLEALTVSLLVFVALATAATFLLARRLRADLPGAAVAGLAFGLGGPLVSSLVNIPFTGGIAGLPVLVLGAVLLATEPGRRTGVVLVALAVANAVLIGDLEAAYLYGVLGLPVALALRRDLGAGRVIARLAGAGALGLSLSAVQLLPSLSIVGAVARGHAVPWADAARWSVHPLRLPGLFLGDLLRFHVTGPGPNLMPLFGVRGSPWLFSLHLGGLTGLGALWAFGLGAGRRRVRWLLALLATAVLLAALGRYGGLYHLLYLVLPGFDHFRYPAKLVGYGALPVALLAGLGLTAALAAPERGARQAFVAALVLLAAAGAVVLAHQGLGARAPVRLAVYLGRLGGGLVRTAGVAGVAAGILFVAARGPGRLRAAPVAAMLLVLLQLGDLVTANAPTLDLISADPAPLRIRSPFATRLLDTAGPGLGRYRVATLVGRPRLPPLPGAGPGYLRYALWKRLVLAPDLPALDGIGSIDAYLPSASRRLMTAMAGRIPAFTGRDAPLFGTPYLVTTPAIRARLGLPPGGELARLAAAGLVLYRFPATRVRPRAFVAPPRFVADAAAAFHHLEDPAVAGGRVALVEGHAPGDLAPQKVGAGTAHITAYAPESVRVSVDVPPGGEQVLVLNDAWYPGWEARLDGRPASILPANLAVRGVLVPPGHHTVSFRYPVPLSLEAGLAGTVAAILGLAALAVRRRHRW